MVDQGSRLLRGLDVGGNSWGTVGRGGNSWLAAGSAIEALLRVTIVDCMATAFAEGAHHKGGTGSTGIREPSWWVMAIASQAATDLAAQTGDPVFAGLIEGCLGSRRGRQLRLNH